MAQEHSEQRYREEEDSLGTVRIPEAAPWGPQTQRAAENFNVSPRRIPRPLLSFLALIKEAYALQAGEMKLYSPGSAAAVAREAAALASEPDPALFPVDVYQTGSGTSWNMNINEVLARRASASLGGEQGVHPNDHVNRGQSSNDVIPAAIQGACRRELPRLIREVEKTSDLFFAKAREWKDVVKLGRTHLQDAVPLTLGHEMEAYGEQLRRGAVRLKEMLPRLEELALGGTAVGTGMNCPPVLAQGALQRLSEKTGIPFRRAPSLFEALSCRDDQVDLAGRLNTLATSLMKIAQDLRLLSSGPRAGLGEILLPELQPGSSIMPGKVNPVIPEMLLQVCARVMGSAVTVTIAGQNGPLEINIMQPLIGTEILESMDLLTRSLRRFRDNCLDGIIPRPENCLKSIDQSLAMVTPLALRIGYEKAAKLAQRAWRENQTVRDLTLAEGLLSPAEAEELFDPRKSLPD